MISCYINGIESEAIRVGDEIVELLAVHVLHVPHQVVETSLHICYHSAQHRAHTQELLRFHTSLFPKHRFD